MDQQIGFIIFCNDKLVQEDLNFFQKLKNSCV